MPVSAEGRVEHQKQNQTATSQWPVGFVFGVQLDYSCRLKSVPSDAEKVVEGYFKFLHPGPQFVQNFKQTRMFGHL